MSVVYIDVGTSTIKAYSKKDEKVEQINALSVHFKESLKSKNKLNVTQKNKLIDFIKQIKRDYPDALVRTYATAFFRNLDSIEQQKLIDEVFFKTEVKLNLLSEDLETYYLEQALIHKLPKILLEKGILIVNIGGGSTELIFRDGEKTLKECFNFGVGTILKEYSSINLVDNNLEFNELLDKVLQKLPNIDISPEIAFYTGGELEYMRLTKYPLKDNELFSDNYHPQIINYEDFIEKSRMIYNEVSLDKLKSLMPKNPDWMKGAKPCTLIAFAIFKKYGAKKIIPSNTNLIHGVSRKEFRKVTISGSFRKHLDYILSYRDKLENAGAEVLSPRFSKVENPGEEFVTFEGEEGKSPLELERFHLNAIEAADVLLVCDPNGYVGDSAMLEIGYANAVGKRVVFTEVPEEFMLNVLPREVVG